MVKNGKRTKFAFVTMSAVMALAGCAGEEPVEPVAEVANEKAVEKEVGVKTVSVGDVIEYNGLIMTLNSVKKDTGDENFKPQNEMFVRVDITVENTTDKDVKVSTIENLSLKGSDGELYKIDPRNNLAGTIVPGGMLEGEFPFDASDSETYELIYEDDSKSANALWKVTIKE